MIHSFSLWDLFTWLWTMLGWSRDKSGVLKLRVKSFLVHVDLLFGLLCAGTGSCAGGGACDCSPWRRCTDLHKNLCWRDIWSWPTAPLLSEGQANLRISSGFSEPVHQSAAAFQTQSISVKLPVQKCSQQPAASRTDCSPWHGMGQRAVGAQSPVQSFSAQERYQPPRVSPREGSPGWWGAGASDVEGEAESAGLFNLEKEQLKGGVLVACSYLLGSCREDESRFLWEIHSERAKGNRHSLEDRKLGNFFHWKSRKRWRRLAGEVLESPSLEMLRTQGDKSRVRWFSAADLAGIGLD